MYVSEKGLSALFVLDSFRKSLCNETPCPEVTVKWGDVMVKSLASGDRGLDANLTWLPPEKSQASYSHHIVLYSVFYTGNVRTSTVPTSLACCDN